MMQTEDIGDDIGFGDRLVSEQVDPEVLAAMPYRVDVTVNDTPLRHRLYSSEPIEVKMKDDGTMVITLTARGVVIHDATDHAPLWLEPGERVIDTIREWDPFARRQTYVFD